MQDLHGRAQEAEVTQLTAPLLQAGNQYMMMINFRGNRRKKEAIGCTADESHGQRSLRSGSGQDGSDQAFSALSGLCLHSDL